MGDDWQSSTGEVVHPNAPRGGGGPGGFRSARQYGDEAQTHGLPHPNSPAGRNAVMSPAQARFLQAHEAKLKFNELNAAAAVSYVQSKMTVGAANKGEDILLTLGGSLSCVADEREYAKQQGWDSLPIEERLRNVAALAEEKGCGNCGEQSAMAFVYLLDRHILPLDWMGLESGKHNYVVVGRTRHGEPGDPNTWGPEAVVCDPWKGEAYSPKMLIPYWDSKPTLLYPVG